MRLRSRIASYFAASACILCSGRPQFRSPSQEMAGRCVCAKAAVAAFAHTHPLHVGFLPGRLAGIKIPISYTGDLFPDFAGTYVNAATSTGEDSLPLPGRTTGYFFFGFESTTGTTSVLEGTGLDEMGHWLVRTSPAVPEPSTFSMLAFCGLAMAGYSRLRRRRK